MEGEVRVRALAAGTDAPPGAWAAWLADALAPDGGDGRLVVHSTRAARDHVVRELLRRTSPAPVRADLHLTLDGLAGRLGAGLGLPARLADGPAVEALVHARLEVAMVANETALVPLVWPGTRRTRGRTRALLARALRLSTELLAADRDPAAAAMRTLDDVLDAVGEALGGIHPVRWWPRLLAAVRAAEAGVGLLPEVGQVEILDLAPDTHAAGLAMLRAVSARWPTTHWTHPGSWRRGESGALLVDAVPEEDEPPGAAAVSAVRLVRANDEIELVLEAVEAWQAARASGLDQVAIIDAAASARADVWRRRLARAGHSVDRGITRPASHGPAGWVRQLIDLAMGREAWSAEGLASLGEQRGLTWLEEQGAGDGVRPRLRPETLLDVARRRRLLPGAGALERWWSALADPTSLGVAPPPRVIEQQEQTQAAMLMLGRWLSPLLDEPARPTRAQTISVATGRLLEAPEPPADADAWLQGLRDLRGWRQRLRRTRPGLPSDAVGLQALLVAHGDWIEGSERMGLARPRGGGAWCDAVRAMVESIKVSAGPAGAGGVRLLTPAEALGVRAGLAVICGLDSGSWEFGRPRTPWLDDEDALAMGVLRPDERVRAGHHQWRHVVACAPEVLVLDPSGVTGLKPSAPLARWLTTPEGETASRRLPEWWPEGLAQGTLRRRADEEPVEAVGAWAEVSEREGGLVAVTRTGARSGRRWRASHGSAVRAGEAPDGPVRPEGLTAGLAAQVEAAAIQEQPDVAVLGAEARTGRWSLTAADLVPASLERSRTPPVPDPRPLSPPRTGVQCIDRRLRLAGAGLAPAVWSASRLETWVACPRRGWLEHGLGVHDSDLPNEDLDARTRGDVLHAVAADLICEGLGVAWGEERDATGPDGLGAISREAAHWWPLVLASVQRHAPWIGAKDPTARLWRRRWLGSAAAEALDSAAGHAPGGMLAGLLEAELTLSGARPHAVEWIFGRDEACVVPLAPGSEPAVVSVHGQIDRVDLIGTGPPLDRIAPLENELGGLPSGRWVVIRDLKWVNGPRPADRGRRHARSVLASLQLAIYARAWELTHPGDRVVGVGISEVGERTRHHVELDPRLVGQAGDVGVTSGWAARLHPTTGDPLRAWMRHALSQVETLLAGLGRGDLAANPTADCDHCLVRAPCGLAGTGGGHA